MNSKQESTYKGLIVANPNTILNVTVPEAVQKQADKWQRGTRILQHLRTHRSGQTYPVRKVDQGNNNSKKTIKHMDRANRHLKSRKEAQEVSGCVTKASCEMHKGQSENKKDNFVANSKLFNDGLTQVNLRQGHTFPTNGKQDVPPACNPRHLGKQSEKSTQSAACVTRFENDNCSSVLRSQSMAALENLNNKNVNNSEPTEKIELNLRCSSVSMLVRPQSLCAMKEAEGQRISDGAAQENKTKCRRVSCRSGCSSCSRSKVLLRQHEFQSMMVTRQCRQTESTRSGMRLRNRSWMESRISFTSPGLDYRQTHSCFTCTNLRRGVRRGGKAPACTMSVSSWADDSQEMTALQHSNIVSHSISRHHLAALSCKESDFHLHSNVDLPLIKLESPEDLVDLSVEETVDFFLNMTPPLGRKGDESSSVSGSGLETDVWGVTQV